MERRVLLRFVGFAVLFVFALYVGLAARPSGDQVALVWPAAGVAVWWLWNTRNQRAEWITCGVALFTLSGLVNLDTGAPVLVAALFGGVNLAHAAVGVVALRRWLPASTLQTPAQLLRLLGVSILAGSVSAVLTAVVSGWFAGADMLPTAGLVLVRNSGTMFVVLATVLALRAPHVWSDVADGLRKPAWVATVLACVGLYLFVFVAPLQYPTLFVSVAAAVLAGLRLGVPTAAVVTSFSSVLAVESAVHGLGAMSLVEDPQARAVLVQALIVLTVVVALTLALLVRGRDLAGAALARQSRDLQDIHDSALVGKAVVRRGDDGGWTLDAANPALVQLLGQDPSGHRWREVLLREDSIRVRDLVDELAIGARDSVSVEVRHLHSDGRQIWTQLHVSRLRGTQHGASLVAQVADLSERKAVEDKLARLALHDPLTGLPNRTQLQSWLATLLNDPRSRGVGVLFLDLDNFKAVNDRLGHDAGDHVLQQVARVLRTDLRPTDLACRLGGDEFVVCCPGISTLAELDAVVTRLADMLAPVLAAAGVPGLGVSIGSTLGNIGDDAEELLRCSDRAMYALKRSSGRPAIAATP